MSKRLLGLVLISGAALAAFSLKAQLPDYQLVPSSLAKNFQDGIRLIKSKQFDAGFQSLDQALAELWRLQIQDLPAYSISLIRVCEQVNPPGKTRDRLLEYSGDFAPHSSEAAFARAHFFLFPAHFSPGEALAEFHQGFQLLNYDLVTRLRLKAMAWIGFARFLEISFLIFSLLVIGRYFRPLFHWFAHLWPADFKKWSLPTLLLILLIPIFIGAPLWAVLAWPAILGLVFASDRIKGIFMFLLLSSAFTGFFYQKGQDLLIPLSKGPVLSQLNLSLGIADSNDLSTLRSEAENSGSKAEILALAEAERRAGNYWTDPESSFKSSSELLSGLAQDPQVSAIADNQLGALYLEFNEVDQALKALENASAPEPSSPEIYYNLSQAYGLAQRFDQSDQAYQKASQLDEKAVARYERAKKLLGVNLTPIRMPIPADLMEKEIAPERSLSLILETGRNKFAGFILAFLMLLALGLRNKTRICLYCGRIICPKCLPESRIGEVCGPCYQVYISGKAVDPKSRMEQKFLVHKYHRLIGWLGIGLNLILPGAGLVFEERAFFGLIVLLWPTLFLTSIDLSREIPGMLVPGVNLWQSWVLAGGGIYLLMSLISIWLYVKLTSLEA